MRWGIIFSFSTVLLPRTDRQTDRPTDRPTDRQADRLADRQAERQTDRQTHSLPVSLSDFFSPGNLCCFP